MRTILFAVVLVACSSSSVPVAQTQSPSPAPSTGVPSTKLNMTVDGRDRTYRLFRPGSLPAGQAAPLVIAMHGYTESPEDLEAVTRLDDSASAHGFVVVYPLGVSNSWNAGDCCGYAEDRRIDDVNFISKLIDKLVDQGGIDSKRVYATGLSNGGMMANRLGCDLAAKIAAVASVSGSVTWPCHPSRPVSVLEMHGGQDPILPVNGGQFPSALDMMSQWAKLDGCSPTPMVTETDTVRTTTWSGCRAGTKVVLQIVEPASHEWFGQPDATDVVWTFLSSSSRA